MKDFIPYQESYILKQLGFDEGCFGFYDRNQVLVIQNCEVTDFHKDSLQCIAPTWQQAFRWFREKYNLVHEICEHPKEMIDYVASKGERYLPTYSYGYSSGGCYRPIGNTYIYEEGEIGCLRKFIEIVK
jgi:hypothetical protein